MKLLAGLVAVGMIADLLSPRRAHLPVCLHEDYWKRRAERDSR